MPLFYYSKKMNPDELSKVIKTECFRLLKEFVNNKDEAGLVCLLYKALELLEDGARWLPLYAIPSLTPEEFDWVVERNCFKSRMSSELRQKHKRYNMAVAHGFKPGKDFYHDENGDFQISEELASFWVLQGFY